MHTVLQTGSPDQQARLNLAIWPAVLSHDAAVPHWAQACPLVWLAFALLLAWHPVDAAAGSRPQQRLWALDAAERGRWKVATAHKAENETRELELSVTGLANGGLV